MVSMRLGLLAAVVLGVSAEGSFLASTHRQQPWELAESKEDLQRILRQREQRQRDLESERISKTAECHRAPVLSEQEKRCHGELVNLEKAISDNQDMIWRLQSAIDRWPSGR
mmetsp:Transcript_90538/g.180142  ORF Transcript_90538/g.180142 Transcript_90538/m.180142 type:complete len:112 (+) Transcript_90538:74-409(+)